MKRTSVLATVAFAGLALVAAESARGASVVTINPTGGTDATNGLKIQIFRDTALMIFREGERQFREKEGIAVAVGNVVNAHLGGLVSIPGATPWTPVSQSSVTGDGSPASPFQVVTTVQNAAGFQAAMTVRYTFPEMSIQLQVVVTPPGGNRSNVKIYHLTDSYLGGDDHGAAFRQPATGTPILVGVTRSIDGRTLYQLFIAGNRIWNHYYSAGRLRQFEQVENGGDLSDSLDTDPDTDNGMGVQWTLGAITGPTTVRYRMSFSTVNTEAVCGDGVATGFETCDDGHEGDGDGCSAICQVEDGFHCTGAPSNCIPVFDGVATGQP